MSVPPASQILILTADAAKAERWAAAVADPATRVWLAADAVADPGRLEIILTDQDLSLAVTGFIGSFVVPRFIGCDPFDLRQDRMNAVTTDLTTRPEVPPGTPGPGVIRIGGEGPADVQLPADVTPREMRLACQLLAEVVRLRRKHRILTETKRRLAEEAFSDPLTGLPNRRAWERTVAERFAATAGSAGRVCLAILDLDHFKRVNDTFGHPAGDQVLRAAGRVLCRGLRESDFVARLGGDEFGLLLLAPDEPTARAVVDRVRRSLPDGLTRHGSHAVAASAGFHLAEASHPAATPPGIEGLFAAADAALAEAKRRGRDRTVGSGDL